MEYNVETFGIEVRFELWYEENTDEIGRIRIGERLRVPMDKDAMGELLRTSLLIRIQCIVVARLSI